MHLSQTSKKKQAEKKLGSKKRHATAEKQDDQSRGLEKDISGSKKKSSSHGPEIVFFSSCATWKLLSCNGIVGSVMNHPTTVEVTLDVDT